MFSRFSLFFGLLLLVVGCRPDLPAEVALAYEALPDEVDYNLHVKPILADKCFACHGPDKAKQKAGLRLDVAEIAFASLKESPDKVAIEPGDLEDSEVFHRIMSTDPEYMMPTPESHLSLTAKEKAVLVKWIRDGAKYKKHWAFEKPVLPDVPEVRTEGWVKNPIDNFVLHTLEKEKLSSSKEADKEILLRRLSLDLTGLPPTIEEIDAFRADQSPDAYEKQVDRLLKSPHYGEKMAVDWMDLARFADSHGYTVDRIRDMSPYRDWVIDAFNKNMPYDKFIHWQLAGDLMPGSKGGKPSKEMLIATAFNRNHQQNMEGGIIEEEFQTEYVIDRTNTLGDAFMGLSLGCAKCHDHKFDPITQKDYYQLYSFFNNVAEAGQISWDDALPTPTLLLPDKERAQVIQFIETKISQKGSKLASVAQAEERGFRNWLASGAYKKLATQVSPKGIVAHFSLDDDSVRNALNDKQVGKMKREDDALKELPVLVEGKHGKAMLMNSDVWLDLQEVGIFRRFEPFSVSMWVNIPKGLKEGVIFHKSLAERLYNFRGYHLYLRNNKLELNMSHTAPSNAITKITQAAVPRDKWIHLTATYDGSSKAAGYRLFMDGQEMAMDVTMDQLYKDILFSPKNVGKQPGLQIGGWWRGYGFKDGKVDEIKVFNRSLSLLEIKNLAEKASWQSLGAKAVSQFSAQEIAELKEYYLGNESIAYEAYLTDLKQSRKELVDTVETVKELMVMQELPKPKKAYVLKRGNYDALGEEVFPDTPESILPFPEDLPKNRYGLAQWLTNEEHPLTARVAVNRYWQNFFGTGIVKTTEDFGNQGELPSHLALLDWLAVTFRESGWDLKKLNKLIVMSATYRQDSKTSKEMREKDPENRLLAHGPSFRMTAEMIRDNALAASGLINMTIGGKSVKPYQPEGLWRINNATYTPDSGAAVYRRSLYVITKRSVPHPTLATFDGSSRSSCMVRRQKTNTPLQALVTLNDPTFVEAAKVLGERMTKMKDSRQAILEVYRRLTGRFPAQKEVDLLQRLQQAQKDKFDKNPAKAKGWLSAGQYKVDESLDTNLIAANAVVAITILNSDASLTKR